MYWSFDISASDTSLDQLATFVLLNVVADYIATRITGEEISISNKHLDQNERLDDFGSRTRPQYFFLTVI